MRIFAKLSVLLAVVFLLVSLAGCGSSPQSAGSSRAGSLAADESISEPVEVTGIFVEFPEPVDSQPDAISMGAGEVKYIIGGTALPPNLFGNPNFASNGKAGAGFVGNWAGGNWKVTNFTANSPGNNPPAPRSLYLPQTEGVKDVQQRFPVEPGSWYYVSIWCYGEERGAGTMLTFALYGNPGDGYGPSALSRVNVNVRFFVTAGEWTQTSFIVQIPSVEDIPNAKNPHLDLRFRQAEESDTPARWFTKAEAYKLEPDSVEM